MIVPPGYEHVAGGCGSRVLRARKLDVGPCAKECDKLEECGAFVMSSRDSETYCYLKDHYCLKTTPANETHTYNRKTAIGVGKLKCTVVV